MKQSLHDEYAVYNGDCIEVLSQLPSESVHYSIFSPPFASLYTYSDSPKDMGNCKTHDEFYTHLGFLAEQLIRVVMPGRLVSFHCMDLPTVKWKDGFIGMVDFPGECLKVFQSHGFIYHSRVTIWKDPLVAASRTKAIGLAHKQIVKDSTMCRQGIADYIITVRKPGDNPEPVSRYDTAGFDRYIGTAGPPTGEKDGSHRHNKFSHEIWRRYASPVWMDIQMGKTLNAVAARSERDERHICPLQLQVIERCVEIWTNPGDTVLSPFAGIGSEGYESLKARRKFLGIELKQSYYEEMLHNLQSAIIARSQGDLVDQMMCPNEEVGP